MLDGVLFFTCPFSSNILKDKTKQTKPNQPNSKNELHEAPSIIRLKSEELSQVCLKFSVTIS